MKLFNFFTTACLLTNLLGCNRTQSPEASSSDDVDILKDCPVVAHYQVIGGDSVLVADFSALKEVRDIPFSALLSSYEIVPLDTCREALTSPNQSRANASENYVLVNPSEGPARLFDRKTGKFLRPIGNIGQGPGEYKFPLSLQIEEDSNLVFIGASRPKRVLQYELSTGNYQKKYELLFQSADILHCNLKTREITTLSYPLPFYKEDTKYFWKQTFDGDLIQGITGIEQVGLTEHNRGGGYIDDRSNSYHVSLWDTDDIKPDTLYHYSPTENRLIPRFTMQWGENAPIHQYVELPHHYYCEVWDQEKRVFYFLIDKQTGRGTPMNLIFDSFGPNIRVGRLSYHNYDSYGICILFDPLQIADELKEEDRQRRIAGRIMNPDSLQNENSWVFIGKWK